MQSDKLKAYNKFIPIEKKVREPTERIKHLKFKLEPIKHWFSKVTSFINHLPIGILFIIFIMALFLSILTANKLRFEYWKNVVIGAYPSSLSSIDLMMGEFISRSNAHFFILFMLVITMFLNDVWGSINSPKPQVLRDYSKRSR